MWGRSHHSNCSSSLQLSQSTITLPPGMCSALMDDRCFSVQMNTLFGKVVEFSGGLADISALDGVSPLLLYDLPKPLWEGETLEPLPLVGQDQSSSPLVPLG